MLKSSGLRQQAAGESQREACGPGSSASTREPATTQLADATGRGRTLLWLGFSVFLMAANLRPLFTSLSAILPEVMTATGLTAGQASMLTTLPVLCLGVFAIPAPALARRFGTERALMAALVLILAGTVLRANHHHSLLFAATAMAGAGIAVCNVLLPGLVKRDFGPWAAVMTGVFTMGLCAGAAGAASFTQPVREMFGGSWTAALAFWAIPALIVVMLWAPRAIRQTAVPRLVGHRPKGLWHDALAWQVTLFMGLQSALAYIMMGWLAPMLRERGLDADTAGYVVGASIIAQMAATLLTPSLAARCRNQSALAAGISVLIIAAFLACLMLPLSGVWLWAALLGLGQGGSISLAIMLIVLRSPDSATTAQLSGMSQGIGYIIAAAGPFIVGLLRDYSGNFGSSLYLIVLIGIVLTASGYGAGRALYVKTRN